MIWDDDQNVQQNKLQHDAADKRLFILILPELSRNPTPRGQKETTNEVKDKLLEVNELVWTQDTKEFCFYIDFESIIYLEVKKQAEHVKQISFPPPFHRKVKIMESQTALGWQ